MAILQWRPKATANRLAQRQRLPGEYAGKARFAPLYPDMLPPELQRAVGQVVEVGFAGVAPDDSFFPGQELYLEWRRDDVFDGFQIPARDLQFLHE